MAIQLDVQGVYDEIDRLPPLFLTVTETARLLKVTEPTVYKLIREYQLPSAKLASMRRVPYEALREWARTIHMTHGDGTDTTKVQLESED